MKEAILQHFSGDFRPFYAPFLSDGFSQTNGDNVLVRCPFHTDVKPSLSVNVKTGQWKCFAENIGGDIFSFYGRLKGLSGNGNFPAILDGICSQFNIVKPAKAKKTRGKSRIIATYDYINADGKLLFQVCRFQPKDFRQRRPNGKGGWIWNTKGIEPVLYNLPRVIKAPEILFVEGEKDADRLASLGFIATTAPMGAKKWRESYGEVLKGKHIIILPDNDEPGREYAEKIAKSLNGKAESIKILNLDVPEKGDVSDWLNAQTDKEMASERLALMIDGAEPWTEQSKIVFPDGFTAAELAAKEFPEPSWVVPGLIVEGLTLLCGKPKMGKSWMALGLALAVASGGKALGTIEVEPGRVLYLPLEDSPRRLKMRLLSVLQGDPPPETLHLYNTWPKINDGGLDLLKSWLDRYQDTSLVIIDTLAKIRPPKNFKDTLYADDYTASEAIKKLADAHSIAIIVIHHLRKLTADDPLDQVSGTTGLTGAADAVAVLNRSRGKADAILSVAGRDMEDTELALTFDKDITTWRVLGNADEYRHTQERQEVLDALKQADEPMKPQEIADVIGKKGGAVRRLLFTLSNEGVVTKAGYGKYILYKQ